jgi:lysozyme
MAFIPESVPQLAVAEIAKILKHRKNYERVVVIALRGYYLDSMGKPNQNDRGIYDDAAFIVETDGQGVIKGVYRYNFNTDPSIGRKGIAVLRTGTWRYKPGIHGLSHPVGPRRYPAFVQAAKVIVDRDGKGEDEGFFGINIHRGGKTTTSSEGCQTVLPDQWNSFYSKLTGLMRKNGQTSFAYELMGEVDRREYLK